jgi:ribosomal protein L17
MEFTREYDRWKNELAAELVAPLASEEKLANMKDEVDRFKGTLMHHIDRLWYEGVLEVIRTGDVYNPGARDRVPRLYLINSYTDNKLGSFPIGESFRLSDEPAEKYEIMVKGVTHIIVRNVEGYISKMPKSTMVKREGNLTRGPDGNNESLVALATFPVAHYVNHRTLRHNNVEKGYVFAVIGDEQATPHFMRYSGLTGGCINTVSFNNFIKQATEGVPFTDRFRLYSVETNWSNGEVVQRGTGANYGDAFLRPGFSYDCVMDYLHSKVIEYHESEQDIDDILSRDWIIKLAASLIPRGMELNEEFIRALRENLHRHIFLKFATEAARDWRIGGDALIETLQARQTCLAHRREIRDYDSYWNEFLSGLAVDQETMNTLEEPHLAIAKRLDQICSQLIDFAKKAHLNNERIASELFNQPKPVDSILDDFAVEAQNFANSLIQSAAFASGALAFRLMDQDVGNVFSSVLAGLNIAMSFGTMTNVARYKIRNEEARVIFSQEKMLEVMKGVFSVMDRVEQDSVPIEQNPFIISLEEQVSTFLENAKYYDCEEPEPFLAAYNKLKTNINDPEEVRFFMTQLTTKFIVDTYHVNSNVQEYLVKIYKTLDDMYRLLTQDVNRANGVSEARKLFDRLALFRPDLGGTLQLGATRFGFIKRRHLFHWDCTVVFKYFYGWFCCSSRSCVLPTAPISTRTSSLIKQARHVSGLHQSQILRREIRDLEGLYWATRESDIASLIFMSSFLVFVASITFTLAFIFNIAVLKNIAFWATAVSATGAILAVFHLWRKFLILVKLMVILSRKIQNAKSQADRDNIRKVRGVTFTQILLTVARFLSAAAAAVALPWSVAVNGFIVRIDMNGSIPFWIALGAVCTAFASTLFFFFVEFFVRYNLSPKLGEFVCESFRDEIEDMYNVLSVPANDIDTNQVQERETWEYVAREFLHRYRFDAVFAADRFGSILQYIQGGMHPPKSFE